MPARKEGLSILQLVAKKRSSLRERPISEEYADCVKLFTGLPACLRAADTDLDL